MTQYEGLTELLTKEPEAKAYFATLPDYVRDMMWDRPQGINSFESLCHYAKNLTRGEL